jgi:chromosome segregation ATPase
VTLAYPARISETSDQISDLMDILQAHRLAENDVNQAAANALREQSSSMAAARDEIEQNIRFLQQDIQRTQEQIDYWRVNSNDLTEQAAQLEALQNQLSSQQQQMEDLRLRRIEISTRVLEQRRQIASAAQQERADLINSENSIREQISFLRQEISRLQNARNQTRMSSNSLNDQIRQAEQETSQQEQKVRALEAGMKNRVIE